VEKPRRPGDPPRLIASSEKIKRELGWQPQFQSLDAIIESAWKWHQNFRAAMKIKSGRDLSVPNLPICRWNRRTEAAPTLKKEKRPRISSRALLNPN